MAARGFDTVVACRTVDKGRGAAARIASAVPGAKVRVLDAPLELADLRSVAAYAEAFKAAGLPLHLLINNAVRRISCSAALSARSHAYCCTCSTRPLGRA